jgi:hypothetical protein
MAGSAARGVAAWRAASCVSASVRWWWSWGKRSRMRAHGGGCAVGGVAGDLAERGDLRVLLGVELADDGAQPGGVGVAAGGGVGVGGGELRGEQFSAAGSEDPGQEEGRDHIIEPWLGGLHAARVAGGGGGVAGVGGVVRAPVVDELAVGVGGHPAMAVLAPDPSPVGVERRARRRRDGVVVAAGGVFFPGVLSVTPGGQVHDGGVDRAGGPQPFGRRDGDTAAVALAAAAVDLVTGVPGVGQDGAHGAVGPPGGAGRRRVGGGAGVQPRGDGRHAEPVQHPPGEDGFGGRGGDRVDDQPGLGAALAGLERVGMREPLGGIPVRRGADVPPLGVVLDEPLSDLLCAGPRGPAIAVGSDGRCRVDPLRRFCRDHPWCAGALGGHGETPQRDRASSVRRWCACRPVQPVHGR